MPNSVFFTNVNKGVTINEGGVTGVAQAAVGTDGYVEADAADTSLVTRLTEQGVVRVDQEGAEEALTAGTVQSATTLTALVFRNSTGATVLNVRDTDATGTIIVGPITIAANAERVIVFPEQVAVAGGVFIDVDSGALHATPGFLIP